MLKRSGELRPRYQVGQKVKIRGFETSAMRSAEVSRFAEKTGTIVNYHYISPNWGNVFYVYTVKMGENEEVVLHEDEIEVELS